jgi:hypothetical protein
LVVGITSTVAPSAGTLTLVWDSDNVASAPYWVTSTALVLPLAVNVTMPWRVTAVGFAATVRVAASPDTPVAGVAVSHSALEDTDQDGAFVVATTVVVAAPKLGVHDVLDKVRVASAPVCVTVTTRETPEAVNVKVA